MLAAKRPEQPARLPLTAAQRQSNAAAAYVRAYLKRGAIAPPDACERCAVEVQAAPSWPLRPLRFFHPDPARPRLVSWLCADCRRRVRATGEPLTLTWTWPGINAPRSRKSPDLADHVAAALTALVPSGASTTHTLREAAFIRLLLRALTPGERERLYAAGVLGGPCWQPTGEAAVDRMLRWWAFEERAERGAAARRAGGTTLTQLPTEPRRQRRGATPPTAPAPKLPPSDPQAAWALIYRAAERLAAAEAAAEETNARVARSIREQFG